MGKLIPRNIPTLFGGVSRQPTHVRRPNQVEAMDNALASVVTGGFEKRPGTQIIEALTALDGGSTYAVHAIDRDADEQRFVLLDGEGGIYAYNAITGAALTVNIGDTKRYFLVDATGTALEATGKLNTSDMADALAFGWDSSDHYRVYHADTTFDWGFISSDAAFQWDIEGSVDGVTWGTIASNKSGTSGTFSTTVGAVATGDHNYIRINVDTAVQAADTFTLWATFKDKTYLAQGVTGPEDFAFVSVADYTFIANRAVVTRMAETTTGVITDTARSTASGTPPAGIPAPTGNGNIYKIINDQDTFATYFVQDDADDDLYMEVANPNGANSFDTSSLPHQLVRNADGTLTFSAASWDARDVGDSTITPNPSFIGKAISDLVFFRNRLGFLADENVFLSKSGDATRLWPDKSVEVLDTDPIDRAATAADVNLLKWATVFRKLLFATSARSQFELSSLDQFTPTTASFDQATKYPASPIAKPQAMGDVLYFGSSGHNNSIVYEYYFDEASLSNTASDVTKHVVNYIPNDIMQIVTDTESGTVFVLTTGEQNSVYVYRTFFDGPEKLQSSWGRYTFGASEAKAFIHGIAVFSGFLVLIIERFDGIIYLEQMPIEREASDADMGYIPLIDQREIIEGTYVSAAAATYWEPTWNHEDDAEVVLGPGFTGDDIGRRMTLFYPDQVLLTLATVTAGQTIVIDDGTTALTFTAHAATTTAANREFSIAGTNAQDATELVACINDATYGHGTITATDNSDGTITLNVDDPCDGSIVTPTGSAVTGLTITVTEFGNRIAARGQHNDDDAYVGRSYEMSVELSKLHMRERDDSPAIIDGRLQVRDITFQHVSSGYYKVTVTPRLRSANEYEFTGRVVGDDDNQIGSAAIDDEGTFRARVNSDGTTVTITVSNDTPFPSVITAAAWRGYFNEIARQG